MFSGRISSPQYPDSYPPGVECIWTVSASAGSLVSLNFESFNLEASDNCNSDYVDVYEDGPHGDHVGRYCGSDVPTNITSANTLWIKFNSDNTGTGPGFIAHYNLLHGSRLSGSAGVIESPMYPLLLFSESLRYHWTITVDQDMKVEISFEEFDLEHNYQCFYTFLAVYDGDSDGGGELFRDCRHQPSTRIVSSNNVVYILLSGDNIQYGVKFR